MIDRWDLEFAVTAKSLTFDAGLFLGLLIIALTMPKRWYLFLVAALFAFYCTRPGLFLAATPLFSRAQILADQASASHCLDKDDTVVILGGGLISPEIPTVASQARLIEASKYLEKALDQKKPKTVVLSGGPTLRGSPAVEAVIYERYLKFFLGEGGAKFHRVLLEGNSLNTYQNAAYVKELLLREKKALKVVLVTGAPHMPRAAATFKRAGFEVCALTAPPYAIDQKFFHFISFANAETMVQTLNEYIGTVGYAIQGWI